MNLRVILPVFFYFIKSAHCLNTQIVINFMDEIKAQQGVIFFCHDSSIVKKFACDDNLKYYGFFDISRLNYSNIEAIMRINYHKFAVIIDASCNETKKLFDICSSLSFFNASYNWLMLSSDLNATINLLNHQNINLDAEITLAVADGDKNTSSIFVLYDVYNPSFKYRGKLVITSKGTFEHGFNWTLKGTKLERRRNLQGIEVNVGVVATGIKDHQTLVEYMESYENPLIDAQHRHHYQLHKILAEKYNYR